MYDGSLRFDTRIDGQGFQNGLNKMGNFAKGATVFKIVEAGFRAIQGAIDGAVNRFDTLNRFPLILEQMGYDAGEASDATQRLSDSVQGLPTSLDAIVSNAQRITLLTGNLQTATDTTIALNDAFLASGSSAADAERGLTQYVQMLSKGTVDIVSWRTLQETMGFALRETAVAMGFVSDTAVNDLYAALQDGEVTFDQFNAKLIELDQGIGGFAELAQTATGGIATSFTNFQTAIVRGVTNIIEAIDNGLRQVNINGISGLIQNAGKIAFNALNTVAKAIPPIIKAFTTLQPLIAATAAGFAAFQLVQLIKNFQVASLALRTMAAATTGMTLAQGAFAGTVSLTQVVVGLLTGQIKLAELAQMGWNKVMAMNPIGLVVIAVAALVAGIIALNNAWETGNEELDDLIDQTDAAKEAIRSINDEYDNSVSSAEASAVAAERLVGELERLEAQGTLTASQQRYYAQVVAEINEVMPEANAAIDEQTGFLKQGTAALRENIQAQKQRFIEEARIARNAALYEQWAELILDVEDAERSLIDVQSELGNSLSTLAARTGLPIEQIERLTRESGFLGIELAESVGASGDLASEIATLGNRAHELSVEEENLNNALNDGRTQASALDDEIAKLSGGNSELAESTGEVALAASNAAATVSEAYDSMSEVQVQAIEGIQGAFETMSGALGDLTSQIELDSSTSWAEILKNQDQVIEKTTEFAGLYSDLIQQGVSESYLEAIGATGPEAIPLLEELLNGGIDTVLSAQGEWQAAYQEVAGTATDAFSLDSDTRAAIEGYILGESGVLSVLKTAVEGADLKFVGAAIPEGLAQGIEEETELAVTASQEMADRTIDGTKTKLGVQSPSTVFQEIGLNIAQGLANGITNGTSLVVDAINKMVQAAHDAAKKAEDINSPSGWWEKNIGRNEMLGWAQGIENNTDKVLEAFDNAIDFVHNNSDALSVMDGAVSAMHGYASIPITSPFGSYSEAVEPVAADGVVINQNINMLPTDPWNAEIAALNAAENARLARRQ